MIAEQSINCFFPQNELLHYVSTTSGLLYRSRTPQGGNFTPSSTSPRRPPPREKLLGPFLNMPLNHTSSAPQFFMVVVKFFPLSRVPLLHLYQDGQAGLFTLIFRRSLPSLWPQDSLTPRIVAVMHTMQYVFSRTDLPVILITFLSHLSIASPP